MLKKAAIVVTITAAGLLATSPMAFAQGATNNCAFTQSGGTITSTSTGGGLGSLVIVAPVTTQTQAANCTAVNVSNLVNTNSNNTTVNETRTQIINSFNTRINARLRALLGL